MMSMQHEILTLEYGNNRLGLVPQLGGSVARWDWKSQRGWTSMFRPWDAKTEDRYTVSCFPLVPWSNRITQGGFEQNGRFHSIAPNREEEAYPIHGDGWLQSWSLQHRDPDRIVLSLESDRFAGNPYHYSATQTFTLLRDGLAIDLTVTHLGNDPLPYGLGLHPYFLRNEKTSLRFRANAVWLAGDDPIPVGYSKELPPTFDYNQPAPLVGPLIDHCFDGWDGKAEIAYPDKGLVLTMQMENSPGYTLMYRPPQYDYFCLEPITQPIDAFHMAGRPGLEELSKGQSFSLHAAFLISGTNGDSPASAR
jgi:aldose 1-epimerase